MAKLPAMQFYPGDWKKDVGVQSLSYHDRAVWFELMLLMFESEERGKLLLNGAAMPEEAIARALGLDIQSFSQTVATILGYGVASRDPETGALMCRRMVRDEDVRKLRKEAGKLGGNPALLNQSATTQDKVRETPSSSSSSSVSSSEPKSSKPAPASSQQTSTAKADVSPEMISRAVLVELRLSGDRLQYTLTDQARLELARGQPPDAVRDAMIAAWRKYDASAAKLAYHCKPATFFGDGKWRNESTWGWKPGEEQAPKRKIYANAKSA